LNEKALAYLSASLPTVTILRGFERNGTVVDIRTFVCVFFDGGGFGEKGVMPSWEMTGHDYDDEMMGKKGYEQRTKVNNKYLKKHGKLSL